MNLSRKDCIELLQALRSLDGIQNNGTFTPFVFEPAVSDKIVANIIVLKRVATQAEEYRNEVVKLLGHGKPVVPGHEAFPEVLQKVEAWLSLREEVDLIPIPKAELNLAQNRVLISARERLLLLEPAAT